MWRILIPAVVMSLAASPTQAQWSPWAEDAFGDRSSRRSERPAEPRSEPQAPVSGLIRDGGPRPDIAPQAPVVVAFPYDYPTSSIVIDASGRRLYYVLGNKQAYMYPISVGREGFDWTGTETISRKQAWPDWHPPQEMRQRDPQLPEKMTGGTRNPLGAMALYLGTTLYRIHGTNDIKSIGQAQSSGCFRMMNASVVHLASVAEVGTLVTVVASLPKGVEVSQGPGAVPVGPAPGPAPGGPVNPQTRPYDYRDLRDYTLRRW